MKEALGAPATPSAFRAVVSVDTAARTELSLAWAVVDRVCASSAKQGSFPCVECAPRCLPQAAHALLVLSVGSGAVVDTVVPKVLQAASPVRRATEPARGAWQATHLMLLEGVARGA